ncbi:MAG: ABC transporter permease [Clostridia bacterium]|nr:ABC transporter permease [Clostridia bacterium]
MGVIVSFLSGAIRLGTTFLFGSTGETITEKSGHLNLGIPGIMCFGALGGCVGVSLVGNVPVLTVLVAIICSFLFAGALGLLYCLLTVTLRANQNVTGLAITTFGVGCTNFFITLVDDSSFSSASTQFTSLFPFYKSLGFVGELLFSYGILVYLAIAIAILTSFFLSKTKQGLHLRAVGENPATADAAGINVTRYRYVATFIGSGIAGLGGLFYIMDYLTGSWEYSIDAMGWLSIALVIFTVWKPNWGILGSFAFGGLYILANYIKVSFSMMSILKMVPFIVTIIVLIFTSIRGKKENQPPLSLGLNYFREER